MAREVVDISLRADISDLRSELGKLPGITDKEAKAMVQSLERQMRRAEKASKQAANASKKNFGQMERSLRNTTRSLNQMGRGLEGVSPGLGGALQGAGALTSALTMLASPLGLVTTGIVAAGVSVGALVFGVVGLAAGLGKATLASEKLIEELKPYQDLTEIVPAIDDDTLSSIERASDSFDALHVIATATTLELGAAFAPVMETVGQKVLIGGLLLQDLVLAVADAVANFEHLRGVVRLLDDALVVLATGLVVLIPGLSAVVTAVTAAGIGIHGASKEADNAVKTWDEYAAEAAKVVAQVDKVTRGSRGYSSALKEEREAQDALNKIRAVGDKARVSQFTSTQKILHAYDDEIASLDELAREYSDSSSHMAAISEARAALETKLMADIREDDAQRTAAAVAEAERREQLIADELAVREAAELKMLAAAERNRARHEAQIIAVRDAWFSASSAMAGAASTAFGLMADHMADKGQAGAVAMFRAQQAAGIAQVAIDTAVAVVRALAMLGPIAGPIASAGIVATGAAQAAVIAATPPPEVAHTGAIIGQSSPLGPDERMVRARVGEGIATPQGVRNLGGASALAAANAGRGGMAGPIVVQQVYRGRVLDTSIQDQLGRQSALRRATASTRPRGRRNPYTGVL